MQGSPGSRGLPGRKGVKGERPDGRDRFGIPGNDLVQILGVISTD